MFTLEQISAAHAKVKSGSDFPAYIQELKSLGIARYTTYVKDGHADYESIDGHKQLSPAKYAALIINEVSDIPGLRKNLLDHQQGKTNYHQFCELAAANGVHNWKVDLQKMTCTYVDAKGQNILIEEIPS